VKARDVSLTAVLAALYAVLVVLLGPLSFQVFQVRVADALLPLCLLFGWPAIWGVTLGCFVANWFGGLGPVDVLGGTLANFLAGYVGVKVGGRSRVLATMLQVLIVSGIVGGYLSLLLDVPLEASFLGVLWGSLLSIFIAGNMVLKVVTKVLERWISTG